MKGLEDYFSDTDLSRITECVRNVESKTSGEIRVVIREHFRKGSECFEADISDIHHQAEFDFYAEGVGNTRDKTGVLVLVVLNVRKFKILADEGIYHKLPQFYLDFCASDLSARFKNGEYTNGICETVAALGEMLAKHFPRRPDDINELPDDVIAGG